jgi:hypothetical protein
VSDHTTTRSAKRNTRPSTPEMHQSLSVSDHIATAAVRKREAVSAVALGSPLRDLDAVFFSMVATTVPTGLLLFDCVVRCMQRRKQVDLYAPGLNIFSTYPTQLENTFDLPKGYELLDGTSMACPHAAGAAGLLWSWIPAASPVSIKSALLQSVDRTKGAFGLEESVSQASTPLLLVGAITFKLTLLWWSVASVWLHVQPVLTL